jgi:eukaryotic-like serine/threonine-protein kinase
MTYELAPGDPELIGPYRLRGRLGAGGMGRVYLGLSPGGRAVAVKVIRAELAQDPEFRARFRREVTVARTVSGLYTAPVLDADADGPEPWLATAYVPGPSLADAVTRHGPLPAASVLMLAAGLAEALSAIHGAGVVHRDLKPANVLLAVDGPRVIDFGISRAGEASALTHTGLVVGSPGFMSPEQAEGREAGPPSDVFSLGAVLAFAATGQGPFGSGSTPALVYRVVHNPPDLDLVPAGIRPLVERCLAKDPAARPTAATLLAGAAYPVQDWLPEPVTRTFRLGEVPLTATATDLAAATAGPAAAAGYGDSGASGTGFGDGSGISAGNGISSGTGIEGDGGRRPQRVRWRSFAVAAVLAVVVGGGGGAAFALTGAPAHATPSARQVAGAAPPPATTPASRGPSRTPASPSAASSSPASGRSSYAAPTYAAPTYAAPSYVPPGTPSARPSTRPTRTPPSSPPPSSTAPATPPSPSPSSSGATPPPTSFPDIASPASGGGTY